VTTRKYKNFSLAYHDASEEADLNSLALTSPKSREFPILFANRISGKAMTASTLI
jgi:hypothetical protein